MMTMKNISILKTIRIIFFSAFLFSFIDLFFNKNGIKIYGIITIILMFVGLVIAMAFGGKLEQEKIEREERKGTK